MKWPPSSRSRSFPPPWALLLLAACHAPATPVEVEARLLDGRPAGVVHDMGVAGIPGKTLFSADGSPLLIEVTLEIPATGVYQPELRDVSIFFFRATYELRMEGQSLGTLVQERVRRLAEIEPLHVMTWPELPLEKGRTTFQVIAPDGVMLASSLALVPVDSAME